MKKITILLLLVCVGFAHASIPELVNQLGSADLSVQTQAQLQLLAECSNAGRPGAEVERKAICEEMCMVLEKGCAIPAATQLVRNIQRIGGAESVPTLVKLLASPDEHLRNDARQALSVNPSAEAGQALQAQLKMRKARNSRETAGLIYALGERREAGTAELISVHLQSTEELVFMASAKALSLLNEDAGIRSLAKQRSKESGARKAVLTAALFETDRVAVFEKLYAENESAEVRAVALLGLAMNNHLNVAVDAMASGDPVLQTAVIEAASQSKSPELYDVIAKNIRTLPSCLQIQAIGALEFSGIRSYAKYVEPLLLSDDMSLKDAAAQALAQIGTVESALALLATGTFESRKALGVLNTEGIDNVLEREAAKKGDDVRRSEAVEALAFRGRRDLIPSFFVYATEGGKETSKSAVNAIGMIGDLSNLEQLTQLMIAKEASPLSRDILNSTVEIMRRSIEPAKAVDILVEKMDSASPRSQANILQALVQTESKEALKPLVDACKSNDEKLQKTAIKLLGGWQGDSALETMIELAGDDSISLANHVVLMRGVSRILAGQKPKKFDNNLAQEALGVCRRPDERQMIQGVINKAKK
jgi:HEAT repeat protein